MLYNLSPKPFSTKDPMQRRSLQIYLGELWIMLDIADILPVPGYSSIGSKLSNDLAFV